MAKEFSKSFYNSAAWEHCRKAYASSVGGLCERCRAKGIYKPGEMVHHKQHITAENVKDPNITLCWDNLELLCRDCHAEVHSKQKRRYLVAADGSVIFGDDI